MPAPRRMIPRVAPMAHSDELLAVRLAYFLQRESLPVQTQAGKLEAFRLEFSTDCECRKAAWRAVRLRVKPKISATRFATLEAEFKPGGAGRDFSFWSKP